jgi:beta-1,2-xylosyltransferase
MLTNQRGLATGLNHNKGVGANWRNSHRERLHFLANDRTNAFQEVLQPIGATGEAEFSRLPLKELGEYYMDAKLAGGHWQCDWGDGTCMEMEHEIEFAEKDDPERSNDYKYVFDVSGQASRSERWGRADDRPMVTLGALGSRGSWRLTSEYTVLLRSLR